MKVDTKRGCTMLNMILKANPAQFSFSVCNLQHNLLRHYVQVKGSFGTREFVACYNSQSFLNNLPYKVLFVFVWEMGPPQRNHLCNSMVIYSFQIDLFNSSSVKSYSFFYIYDIYLSQTIRIYIFQYGGALTEMLLLPDLYVPSCNATTKYGKSKKAKIYD